MHVWLKETTALSLFDVEQQNPVAMHVGGPNNGLGDSDVWCMDWIG